MFIQVIHGMCTDEAALRRRMATWREEIAPGADGWLGATYGLTDDGRFVGVVRFESRDAAMRNSARPEQSAWWEATRACFDGDPDFHDCDDPIVMLDGGSDDAGFVQVIEGRLDDPQHFREWMSQSVDVLHEARPDLIGATVAIDDDGWFAETVAFRSEAEARAGEARAMPAQVQEEWEREMAQAHDVTYLDLHHPWFVSAGTRG
jgi:hypothetical protein